MMALLTTLSLVGSLVLWAGYQAFYVPNNYTDPLAGQNSLDDPFGGQNLPQKAFGRARFHPQTGNSILPQVNSISRTGASSLNSKRELEMTTSDFMRSYSTQRSDTNPSPYSVLPFGELLTETNTDTKSHFDERKEDILKDIENLAKIITQTGEFINPDHTPNNAVPITGSMVNHSVGLTENITSEMKDSANKTTTQASGEDYIQNATELDQLITIEDSHTLSSEDNASDHNTIEKQQLENLNRLVTDLPVRNDSLHMAKKVNQSVSSLNILYTLVTFVKNLESQERGNFSKTFDNLLYFNISNTNTRKGTAKVMFKHIEKSLLNSSDETESNVTGGSSETQEFIHNNLGITPAERVASEDAKVLSKEYMDHFGWQGYLLIFFIIVIVLLLITTLILFASSYFTWRNRRKQTKTTKAANSHKEA